jgi:hypothetical protein
MGDCIKKRFKKREWKEWNGCIWRRAREGVEFSGHSNELSVCIGFVKYLYSLRNCLLVKKTPIYGVRELVTYSVNQSVRPIQRSLLQWIDILPYILNSPSPSVSRPPV